MEFGLPDEACRAEILKLYAKHLSQEDIAGVAAATTGLAGRDLKDLSEQAERRWASKVWLASTQSHMTYNWQLAGKVYISNFALLRHCARQQCCCLVWHYQGQQIVRAVNKAPGMLSSLCHVQLPQAYALIIFQM